MRRPNAPYALLAAPLCKQPAYFRQFTTHLVGLHTAAGATPALKHPQYLGLERQQSTSGTTGQGHGAHGCCKAVAVSPFHTLIFLCKEPTAEIRGRVAVDTVRQTVALLSGQKRKRVERRRAVVGHTNRGADASFGQQRSSPVQPTNSPTPAQPPAKKGSTEQKNLAAPHPCKKRLQAAAQRAQPPAQPTPAQPPPSPAPHPLQNMAPNKNCPKRFGQNVSVKTYWHPNP